MRKINLLSVVIPCYNEQEVIRTSHERLTRVLGDLVRQGRCAHYELIYIDDGSQDDTLRILKELFATSPVMRIVSFRKNCGLQGAISAGLFYAEGDAVVTIDADLQDPPEKMDEMIDHYQEGYDLVLGIRQDRSSDTFLKKFFAENYYRLMKLMGVEIIHNHGDFRLMARSLVKDFNQLPERNRFVRAMIFKLESRYASVFYRRESRAAGKTKFTTRVMLNFSLDGIISFSDMPLRLVSLFGALMCLLSFLGILWVFYVKITQNVIRGWASTLLPIFAIGGFQIFFLGIIGEYIAKLLIEVKQRPIYLVREEFRHAPKEGESL